VRLTRHARNRLRWIAKSHPRVTAQALAQSLPKAKTMGYDDRGNRKVQLVFGEARLTVVVDDAARVVVTVWVE